MSSELQQTLAKSASVSGTSLHTGEKVTLKLQPAPVDSGIVFKRRDLAEEPMIAATIANLKTVERATTIGEGSMRVHTVEHILSSLAAMGVDNAIVEMDANEPPIGDVIPVRTVCSSTRTGPLPIRGKSGVGEGVAVGVAVGVGAACTTTVEVIEKVCTVQ